MRALLHLLQTALNDRDELENISAGFVDDASRLNRTQVAEIRSISGPRDNLEGQLRAYSLKKSAGVMYTVISS